MCRGGGKEQVQRLYYFQFTELIGGFGYSKSFKVDGIVREVHKTVRVTGRKKGAQVSSEKEGSANNFATIVIQRQWSKRGCFQISPNTSVHLTTPPSPATFCYSVLTCCKFGSQVSDAVPHLGGQAGGRSVGLHQSLSSLFSYPCFIRMQTLLLSRCLSTLNVVGKRRYRTST